MDYQRKVNEFIELAKNNKFDDVYFEGIRFMGRSYNRIHYSVKGFTGTFDVSYDEFAKASNELIIRMILNGLKYNG